MTGAKNVASRASRKSLKIFDFFNASELARQDTGKLFTFLRHSGFAGFAITIGTRLSRPSLFVHRTLRVPLLNTFLDGRSLLSLSAFGLPDI
jgi:hypothetical protein